MRECKQCRPCPHGKVRKDCAICAGCPHGKLKQNCGKCRPCPHGKLRQNCKNCSGCPHGKLKFDCRFCYSCAHGRLKRRCTLCRENRELEHEWPRKWLLPQPGTQYFQYSAMLCKYYAFPSACGNLCGNKLDLPSPSRCL